MPVTHAHRKLSVSFIIITLSFTAFMAVLVTALQIYLTYKNEMSSLYSRYKLIEQSYNPSLAESLWTIDEQRIAVLLDGIYRLPEVGQIVLTDDTGKQWRLGQLEANTDAHQQRFTLEFSIDGQRYSVGSIEVSLITDEIYRNLLHKALAISITTVLSLVAAALILLYLFRHAISRHLENMAGYAEAINRHNLEQPLSLNRPLQQLPDELDMVVNAINQMRQNILSDLKRREEIELELIRHRQHLETLVSERTKALEQSNQLLKTQSQELVAQNAELNAYAHTVAHDLKHPLTALLGQTALLKGAGSAMTEQQRTYLLSEIHHCADKMNNIINALLMLASVRRADSVNTSVLDIKAIANEAHNLLRSFANNHQARISYSEDWPLAVGFAPWLEQVWVNYLSNAIKYGGDAPQIRLGADTPQQGKVRYWVEDNGPGISADKQASLFSQFNRLDAKTADGHGLGLSIVQRIIQRLGGEVGYEALPQGGSRFWFSLPAATN